ncbi:Target of rapamycin complex 2 subunit bit61 [Escovopsis weberi]|uniref:Target of rapamycin complex 2 subunit bit61 n=1 Tax=Escovopsis weberi TaxID=150374 RepID=A0A0M8MSI7_ESCWE|nr:Target of rapamycin complex 2 subunit bit61 [Escovopsis weberi]
MQPASFGTPSGRPQGRAPGTISSLSTSSTPTGDPSHPLSSQLQTQPPSSASPQARQPHLDSPTRGDDAPSAIAIPRTRPNHGAAAPLSSTPIYHQFATAHANPSVSGASTAFSRPNGARTATHGPASSVLKTHARKHAATQGMFEPTLPSTSTSSLSLMGINGGGGAGGSSTPSHQTTAGLTASQIAAQAAVASHSNALHFRQRSSTVPFPGETETSRRGSGSKVPINPPMLSLTEASTPRESGFPSLGGGAHQERQPAAASHSPAATAAANVVFPRSGQNSPTQRETPVSPQPPAPSALASSAAAATEKLLSKSEKAKAKLFSRPGKIGTKGDVKDKPLPSPGKIGNALSALQRNNFSANSLADPNGPQLYSLSNSSSATIRPLEPNVEEKGKEKEKKHHFLSRQKQKLKEDYHLPLSSAASNSRPTDPNAPSSLYNFSVPPSPSPHSSSFAKSKKDKKHGDRSEHRNDGDASMGADWPGSSSLPALSPFPSNLSDVIDLGKSAPSNMSMEDAWPYLKAKLLVIFQGEDLRLPIEDINRVVQSHIQWCVHKRSPNAMLDDLRDLLAMGFSTMDRTLRKTPEDRFMPTLVELWLFTFTSILPYMQAAFLPLDLEVAGCGTIMTADHAREFWGGVATSSAGPNDKSVPVMPAATILDVRRLVLTAYRDIVILPRYDSLKTIFSRLSLEFLPSAFSNMALASPPESGLSTSPSESFSAMARPGTAMSLDPSVGSCASTSTTLLSESSVGSRSRAVSNVSLGSRGSDGLHRPFTPSGVQILSSVREQNVEDSKQVTDMVGRMLQCMSVLSSLGGVGGDANDDGNRRMVELCKMLKLNWLGRGRTGRNRMGIVGGRVRRDEVREEVRVT